MAARNNHVTINMADITEGINKVLMGPQKKSRLITEHDKKLTAFHESGHAIIAKSLNTGDDVHEVSIIPRGMAGGYTSTRPSDDDEHYTYSRLNGKICMMMGGRVAEELVFGDITAGASSDIKHATDIARRMVTEWGMSKKLGFLNLGKSEEVFIGRDYQVQTTYSESTATIIDQEIKVILDENYKKAKEILTEKRKIMDNMANLLLMQETIYQEEVDEIMSGKDAKTVSDELTEKLKKRKDYDDKRQLELKLQSEMKAQEMKQQTAVALKNAGVISQSELEIIKQETDSLRLNQEKILNDTIADGISKAKNNEQKSSEKKDGDSSAQKVEETKSSLTAIKEDLDKKANSDSSAKKKSSKTSEKSKKNSSSTKQKTDKNSKKDQDNK